MTNFVIEKTLTSAEIASMYTTPVVVMPKPGENKVIIVESIALVLEAGSVAYTGGGAVSFNINSVAQTATIAASGVTSSSKLVNKVIAASSVVAANTELVVTNATAVFAAGNGIAKIMVKGTIMDI